MGFSRKSHMDIEKLELRLKEISGGKTLDRYKDIPDFSAFKEKINKVLLWIDTYGYAPASSLFFIGRKQALEIS